MLEVRNVKVVYNDVILVLKGISLSVAEGSIVALLGANGAGKTTTAKAVCGLLEFQDGNVTEGTIEFFGARINDCSPEDIVGRGISMVPEGRRVFVQLTVEENLKVGSYLRRDSAVRKDLEDIWQLFPSLWRRRDVKAGYLSGGEQQMLAIGRAMMSRPRLLILDEPSLGLSPRLVEEVFQVIARLNKEANMTLLIIEQNAHAAFSVARYGYIMENGRIVMDADTDRLVRDADVKEFYLGITDNTSGRKSFNQVKSYKRRKRWLS
ncbi:MAG: ABC transporter ATP-binding protein [Clostridia bacterium]|nr:MAG: ABC transporter ATP-binding protein [Clostridia bacterium]